MIEINIKKATEFGKLNPVYDKETGILSLTSDNTTDWVYGIDVDGTIIFDINKDYRLENFDLLIPKKLWVKMEIFPLPEILGSGDLHFSKSSIEHKSFYFKHKKVFQKGKKILIVFDEYKTTDTCYKISESCLALINDNLLYGFVINLESI